MISSATASIHTSTVKLPVYDPGLLARLGWPDAMRIDEGIPGPVANLTYMSTPSEIDAIREAAVEVLLPYVDRIALFGSVARGEAGPTSDVDLLVRLRPPPDRPPLGLRWFELERILAERLGRKVDLATEKSISRHVRPYIEQDLRVLYEE